MKRNLLVLLLLLGAMPLAAQWFVIPEVGVNTFKLRDDYSSGGWHAGLKAGVAVEYRFKGDLFALQSGVFYMRKRFSYHYPSSVDSYDWQGQNHLSIDIYKGKSDNNYLQIPLLAKFGWNLERDLRLHVALGPVVDLFLADKGYEAKRSYAISGKEEGRYNYSKQTRTYDNDAGKTLYGGMFEAGIDIKQWTINTEYDISFYHNDELLMATPGVNNYRFSREYHTVSLMVGYRFKL